MNLDFHFTVIASESVSISRAHIEVNRTMGKEVKPIPNVIDLESERERRKCKRCNGAGIIAVEVALQTIADSYALECSICPYCLGKRRR